MGAQRLAAISAARTLRALPSNKNFRFEHRCEIPVLTLEFPQISFPLSNEGPVANFLSKYHVVLYQFLFLKHVLAVPQNLGMNPVPLCRTQKNIRVQEDALH